MPRAGYAADGGPFDGTCLTTRRAAFNAAGCSQEHEEHQRFEQLYREKPTGIDATSVVKVAAVAAGVGFLVGIAATAYAVVQLRHQ